MIFAGKLQTVMKLHICVDVPLNTMLYNDSCVVQIPVTTCRVSVVNIASTIKTGFLIASSARPIALRQVPALSESVVVTDALT